MQSRYVIAKNKYTIIISVVVAILLTILPLPTWGTWLRPIWLLLVLCYWVVALPDSISVGTAWICGMLLDVMQGTTIGQHAFAFTAIIYVASRSQLRLRLYPRWQQSVVIGLLALMYLGIIFWVQGLLGQPPLMWGYWLPAVSTAVMWPILFKILGRNQYRFGVR